MTTALGTESGDRWDPCNRRLANRRSRAALPKTFLNLLIGLARSHEERGEYEKGLEALRKAIVEEPTRARRRTWA